MMLDPKKAVRSLAILADQHIGSPYSPWPETPILTREGNNISKQISRHQRKMNKGWYSFIEATKTYEVDTVIIDGDTIQGCNPKESGYQTLTPDIEYQKDAAEVFLEPLVTDRRLHVVRGTAYHESADAKIHRDLVKRLKPVCEKASYEGPIFNGRIKGTGLIINVAHKFTEAKIYTASIFDRERMFMRMAEALSDLPHIDIVVRAHLHFYLKLQYEDMCLLQCPAWQAWYPFKDAVRLYGKHQHRIGGLILMIDDDDEIYVKPVTCKAPRIVDMVKPM